VTGLRGLPSRLGRPAVKVAALPKVVEGFYQSKAWLALRRSRMRDADYAAAVARAGPGERVILDHIVERRDGGAELDPANTQWLTMAEHQAKTSRERARRAARRGGGSKSEGRHAG
jgi:5-methylcytosine-specific restriction enzyme A